MESDHYIVSTVKLQIVKHCSGRFQKSTFRILYVVYANGVHCMPTAFTVCQRRSLYATGVHSMPTAFTVCQRRSPYANGVHCMPPAFTLCHRRSLYANHYLFRRSGDCTKCCHGWLPRLINYTGRSFAKVS